MGFSAVVKSGGRSLLAVHRLLIMQASLAAGHRLLIMRASLAAGHRLWGTRVSAVAAQGLGSSDSWALELRFNSCGARA